MTGAGAAQVAYAPEDSFGTLPGTPSWTQPFVDLEVGEISLTNNSTPRRQPDDPRARDYAEGPLQGTATVSGTMTDTNFHELVFADSGTGLATTGMQAPTATWYFDSKLLSGNADRFLAGGFVTSCTWSYTHGEDVTIELSIEFRAGEKDLSTTSSITQPSTSDAVPWHGTTFQVDGTEMADIQSLSLELSGLARHRPQADREARDAVVGEYDQSIQFEVIPNDESQASIGYGSTTAASTQDTVAGVGQTLEFANANGTLVTYNISSAHRESYDWNNLVAGDSDLVEVADDRLTDVAVA